MGFEPQGSQLLVRSADMADRFGMAKSPFDDAKKVK